MKNMKKCGRKPKEASFPLRPFDRRGKTPSSSSFMFFALLHGEKLFYVLKPFYHDALAKIRGA
jgi:hypothetical protein